MDNEGTRNLALTFQLSLDCFLKEESIENEDAALQTAKIYLKQASQYRSKAKRYEIAKKTLDACPRCLEAYLIMAAASDNLFQRIRLLKEGMEQATLALGKQFFLQQIDDFYSIQHSHLYFQIKYSYALSLWEGGYVKKAEQQCREILNLNPSDYYHVHELLYAIYLFQEDITSCLTLLKHYQDQSTLSLYFMFLLQMKQQKFKAAREMVPLMKEANPYLYEMITHQRICVGTGVRSMIAGSESEASYIYLLLYHQWNIQKGVDIFMIESIEQNNKS